MKVDGKHFVELDLDENNLLKGAMMVFLAALARDTNQLVRGLRGGQAFMQRMGEERFFALMSKMDAHQKGLEAEQGVVEEAK